jgi:hypothetical protein
MFFCKQKIFSFGWTHLYSLLPAELEAFQDEQQRYDRTSSFQKIFLFKKRTNETNNYRESLTIFGCHTDQCSNFFIYMLGIDSFFVGRFLQHYLSHLLCLSYGNAVQKLTTYWQFRCFWRCWLWRWRRYRGRWNIDLHQIHPFRLIPSPHSLKTHLKM